MIVCQMIVIFYPAVLCCLTFCVRTANATFVRAANLFVGKLVDLEKKKCLILLVVNSCSLLLLIENLIVDLNV